MPLRLIPPLHRATHRVGLYLAALGEHSLSQGEAHILALLAERRTATIAELHKGLAHKRSTLTSILDRLATRQLITREVGTADRRTFVISLTARGHKAAVEVHRHLAHLERLVGAHVTRADAQGFLNVLSVLEKQASGSDDRDAP